MFEGTVKAELYAKVAVLLNGKDVQVTQHESICTLQEPGTTVEYHYVCLLNVDRQLPFTSELMQAI